MLFALPSLGQVSPIPFIKPTWTNNSGQPCSGCQLFTYQAGTTTPLVTYSDSAGTVPNSNPVLLDATGRADVFLGASAYKFVLQSASGITYWTEDNITSSSLSLLASNNTWTGTNTWQSTSTFNGPTNFNVGFTSLGPNTLGGGGSISGTWSGSPTFSGTPNFSGSFDAVNGVFSGQIFSTNTTMAPFVVMSSQEVVGLNANLLENADWPSPGTIGSTVPNLGVFTTLQANTSFKLNGSTALTSVQGSGDTKLLSAGTFTGATGVPICKDANGGAGTTGCLNTTLISTGSLGHTSCTTGSSSFDTCTSVVTITPTMPDIGYVAGCTGNAPSDPRALIQWVQVTSTSTLTATVITEGSVAVNFADINCWAIHP